MNQPSPVNPPELRSTFVAASSMPWQRTDFDDAEGSCGAGDFVRRPGGNVHVAYAPNGATFLSVFNRPNRFFDGTKFFTSAEDRRQDAASSPDE
ncbi:hypothetical protein IVB30_21790 [Bradyrhizobium sp. 200]|uniref:hypothetical protein n=1 Tax=Bradyrhizobium sp. 200 TaxID=2782665 RepID=UPI0020005715|nr:hypothetical protein [Bradyrhizobium sp. 200]UPJ53708.1 hypothetical protein IVB30_21790 [Bradyrhizobium sp. 200]